MDGLYGKPKTLLKLMIWGYHYFWKHPFGAGLLDYWVETSTNTFNCFAAGAASQAMYELSKSMKQPLPSGKLR